MFYVLYLLGPLVIVWKSELIDHISKLIRKFDALDLAPDSPLRVQGNLTGIPRKLKDLAADWYNAEVKWKNSCYNGFQIASKIGNLKVPR